MGTVTFSIEKVGQANRNVRGRLVTSGAHTTTTSASALTDGAAGAGSAVNANKGDILTVKGSEDMRIMFGGETATATLGHIIYASETADLEITARGAISIIDVA